MEHEKEIAHFCENVKKLREAKGLTKKQMASFLHIGTKTLSAIEKGMVSKRLRVDVLIYIHDHFGIPPHAMLSKL